jgi:hypothetical protein
MTSSKWAMEKKLGPTKGEKNKGKKGSHGWADSVEPYWASSVRFYFFLSFILFYS